jgi:hypothetical protein
MGLVSEAMQGHRFVRSENPMVEEPFSITSLGRPKPVSR